MRPVVALAKFLVLATVSLVLLPFQCLIHLFFQKGSRIVYIIPCLWHSCFCGIFGIRVRMEGMPEKSGRVLFISNHMSYLDISVLSTVIPASFISKEEVAGWPIVGLFAKLHCTAFIARTKEGLAEAGSKIRVLLAQGKNVILFPEGTSTSGQAVLPFKASLFNVAFQEPLVEPFAIQPLTLTVDKIEGKSVQPGDSLDLYAWYGDMFLAPHIWQLAKLKGMTVTCHFHAPVLSSRFENRKILTQYCYDTVASGLAAFEKESSNDIHEGRDGESRGLSPEKIRA